MTTNELLRKFDSAITWNGASYLIYKIISTALSFILFKKLSASDFALWATANSLIYLSLLWLDLGLRHSLALYLPKFVAHKRWFAKFTFCLIAIYLTILLAFTCCAILLFHLFLDFNISFKLLALTGLLLLTEGIVSLVRLLYHAQFFNKIFNLTQTIVFIIESIIITFSVLFLLRSTENLVYLLFGARIISGLVTMALAFHLHPQMVEQTDRIDSSVTTQPPSLRSFLYHSLIMWIYSCLKSLSERNFLLPLVMYLHGPLAGSHFKLAQDSSLLFSRFIVKTVGSNDTALLAYSHMRQANKDSINYSILNQLIFKITNLCLPVISLCLLLLLQLIYHYQEFVFDKIILAIATFFILILFNIIESILSPYKRIIEIKRHYTILSISHIPYIFGLLLCVILARFYSIDLLAFISFVYFTRLTVTLFLVYYTYIRYSINFPYRFLISRISIVFAATYCFHRLIIFLSHLFPINVPSLLISLFSR